MSLFIYLYAFKTKLLIHFVRSAEKYACVKNLDDRVKKCQWRHIRKSNDVINAIRTLKEVYLLTKVDVSKDIHFSR